MKDIDRKIKNFMTAIEEGIITPTTKERLEELEQNRRETEGQIAKEEIKKPLFTEARGLKRSYGA